MGPVCGLWFTERDQTVAGGGLGMTVPIADRQMQFHTNEFLCCSILYCTAICSVCTSVQSKSKYLALK